jgi:hypothetical protein
MEMAFAAQILPEFRAYGRQPGHYTGFGVTSGWAVIRPELAFRFIESFGGYHGCRAYCCRST